MPRGSPERSLDLRAFAPADRRLLEREMETTREGGCAAPPAAAPAAAAAAAPAGANGADANGGDANGGTPVPGKPLGKDRSRITREMMESRMQHITRCGQRLKVAARVTSTQYIQMKSDILENCIMSLATDVITYVAS